MKTAVKIFYSAMAVILIALIVSFAEQPKFQKMHRYEIVFSSSAADLKTKVEARLKEGWTLVGGVTVSRLSETLMYGGFFQAMDRYE